MATAPIAVTILNLGVRNATSIVIIRSGPLTGGEPDTYRAP